MKDRLTRTVFVSAWAWVPGVAIAIFLLYGQGSSLEAQTPLPADSRADPAQFRAGKLDREAVDLVQSFKDFPVVWLGEEYGGYKLSAVARVNNVTPPSVSGIEIRDNRLILVYGDCAKEQGDWGCTPPLTIIIWAPDTIPGSGGVAPEAKGESGTLRGLSYAIVSESTVLWAGSGIAIQIHSNSDIRDDVVQSLRSANDKVMGLPEIKTRESMTPLKDRKGPIGPGPTSTPMSPDSATPTAEP